MRKRTRRGQQCNKADANSTPNQKKKKKKLWKKKKKKDHEAVRDATLFIVNYLIVIFKYFSFNTP